MLREPLWDTEQALLPADVRLHGREELALQMLSIRHRVELIYFVRTFALCLCNAFVLVCVFCAQVCMTMHAYVCIRKIKRGLCVYMCLTEYVCVCLVESV